MSKVRSIRGIRDRHYKVAWFPDISCKNKGVRSVGNKIKFYGMCERTLDLYLIGLTSEMHYLRHSLRFHAGKTRRNFDMGSQLFPISNHFEMVSCLRCSICCTVCSMENLNLSGVLSDLTLCENVCTVVMSLYSIFVLSVVKCFMLNLRTVASLLVTPTQCSWMDHSTRNEITYQK